MRQWLAVLMKGLLGLFPLFVVLGYLALVGRLGHVRNLMPVWGSVLFAVLTVPWHLVMAWQNEGFLRHYFLDEQFLRFLGRRSVVDYVSLPLPVFLLVQLLWLVPWSTYLLFVVLANPLRHRDSPDRGDQGALLIWLWAAAILGFFSLSQARLHQYLLPAMPALGLLIAKSLDDRLTDRPSSTRGLVALSVLSILLFALGFFLVPTYVGRYYPIGPAQTASLSRTFFLTLITGGGVAALAFARRRWAVGIPSLVCSTLAVFFVAHHALVLLEPSQSSKPLAAFINRDRQPGDTIVLEIEKDGPFEYEEVAGLAFYTGQKVYLLRERTPPEFPLPLPPEERFMLSEAEFHRLWGSEQHIYLVTDALDRRSPFVLVGRVGDRWVLSNQPASRPGGQSFTAALP